MLLPYALPLGALFTGSFQTVTQSITTGVVYGASLGAINLTAGNRKMAASILKEKCVDGIMNGAATINSLVAGGSAMLLSYNVGATPITAVALTVASSVFTYTNVKRGQDVKLSDILVDGKGKQYVFGQFIGLLERHPDNYEPEHAHEPNPEDASATVKQNWEDIQRYWENKRTDNLNAKRHFDMTLNVDKKTPDTGLSETAKEQRYEHDENDEPDADEGLGP